MQIKRTITVKTEIIFLISQGIYRWSGYTVVLTSKKLSYDLKQKF